MATSGAASEEHLGPVGKPAGDQIETDKEIIDDEDIGLIDKPEEPKTGNV